MTATWAEVVSTVPVPFATAAANILVGSATADAATIITIPAGRAWKGTVVLSAALGTAPAVAGATADPTVSTAGTNVVPAAGVVLRTALRTGGGSAAATVGTNSQGTASIPLTVIAPPGNAATLTLQLGGATAASASASGELL